MCATMRHSALQRETDRQDGHTMQLRLADYPQLRLIAWNRRDDAPIAEEEAFALYERNWHYIDQSSLSADERQLIEHLVRAFGNGVMNV